MSYLKGQMDKTQNNKALTHKYGIIMHKQMRSSLASVIELE